MRAGVNRPSVHQPVGDCQNSDNLRHRVRVHVAVGQLHRPERWLDVPGRQDNGICRVRAGRRVRFFRHTDGHGVTMAPVVHPVVDPVSALQPRSPELPFDQVDADRGAGSRHDDWLLDQRAGDPHVLPGLYHVVDGPGVRVHVVRGWQLFSDQIGVVGGVRASARRVPVLG